MPAYEVKVLLQVVMHVNANSEEEANMAAFEDVDPQKADHKEVQSTRLLETKEAIEQSLRHCDQVLNS